MIDRETGRAHASALGPAIVLASQSCHEWRSPLVFEVHRMSPHEYGEHRTVGHQLMINLGDPVRFGWLEGDRRRESVLLADGICLQSDGDANAPRWQDELVFATAAISPTMLETILGDRTPRTSEVFPKRHCIPAAMAGSFARSLASELAAPTEPLYAEILATAFVLHLVAAFGRGERKHLAPKGKLGAAQLRAVVTLAHEHLASRLTLEMMASAVGYSVFQFARLFKATTGRAPHRFVLELRLERARRLLVADARIADVAAAAGFYDQAHFTNVFRKAHGVTPAAYALAAGLRRTRKFFQEPTPA